jgi:hypothetical protein
MVEIDLTVFLNYGIAGLILLVFYLLFKNELTSLRDTINQLRVTQEKMITLLEVLIEKLKGEKRG